MRPLPAMPAMPASRTGCRASLAPLPLPAARTALGPTRLGPPPRGRSIAGRGGAAACRASPPAAPPLPPVVNWHLEARCNYGCRFCFATFEDVKQALQAPPGPQGEAGGCHAAQGAAAEAGPGVGAPTDEQLLLVPRLLAESGVSRLSFVGGEPLLHPHIHPLIRAAKAAGLATSLVTNASLLDAPRLLRLAGSLDWLAVSVDASSDALHAAIGRGVRGEVAAGSSRHLAHVLEVWGQARELGFRLKLNTVVSRAALGDNMAPLVLDLQPERWKVFQVLPITGQNDGSVDALLISRSEFEGWVARDRAALLQAGSAVPLVAEGNEEMQGSYAMLDAACRFFSNSTGRHTYGPPTFSPGLPQGDLAAAWAAVSTGFDGAKFGRRGGVYDWGQGEGPRMEQAARWGGRGG